MVASAEADRGSARSRDQPKGATVTTAVLRTVDAWWVRKGTRAARIDTTATTTRELLADRETIDAAASSSDTLPIEGLRLLSPVTAPCRIVATMANYASHAKDTAVDPRRVPLTFFRKASGSISGPFDDIVKPGHISLLDYEVEVGLVIGRDLAVGATIADANLSDYIAGLVVTNDVSARDLQLTKTQFYEAKSYPTFTPVGPALVLLDADELQRFGDLRLRLRVNGQLRQDMVVAGDIIYPPLHVLQGLAQFQQLDAGDLVLTGTPVGTALSAPPRPVERLASVLSTPTRLRLFFARQSRNRKYLHEGDVVETSIATDDKSIDLGAQRTVVRFA